MTKSSLIGASAIVLSSLLFSCEIQGLKKSSSPIVQMSVQSQAAGGLSTFKSTVYALAQSKCASCHGRDALYPFADDNVNSAYAATKALVNFTQVWNSSLMIGVDDGHCGPACAGPNTTVMQNGIVTWAKAEGYNPTVTPPPVDAPTGAPVNGSGISVYQSTVYPILLANCSGCHNGSQSPNFAVVNVGNSYTAAKTVVDFNAPANSKLYGHDMNGHCGQAVCMTDGTIILNAIEQWAAAESH